MKLVAATGNQNKLREIRHILPDFTVITEGEAGFFGEVEETGKTFLENALLKARAVCRATGLAAIADDSGLCVDALGGAPGVYSARYASKFAPRGWKGGNNAFLLQEMEGVEDRRAHFACAVAVVFPDGREVVASGESYGSILTAPRGTDGFGYDPLFFSDDLQKTFAEADEAEKNFVSHRGRALKALVGKL